MEKQDCLQQVECDPTLLDRVITGDESWFFHYDRETKRRSQQWLPVNALRPKIVLMRSKVMTMLICVFNS